jgi:tRNA A37 methylthiotransferase MiaB
LPAQVSALIKRDRVHQLRDISHIKKSNFIKKNINLEHQIVVETVGEDVISGTTSNYIKALLPRNGAVVPGSLVRIRLTGINNECAIAFPITDTEPVDK